jgi:two-component system NtrC family sensor kinase
LVRTFADQAVIAMENARLLTETREALEQQTATAEVLQVINASPGDVQPTFDAIAASATRLCAAASGAVFRFDGAQTHLAAHYNCSPVELEALRATYPCAPSRGSVTGRAILTRAVAYVADIGTDPEYALPRIVQSGMRAHLSVPMLQDGNPVGAITVARREATPFSETQIELLKTFAAQAVIAMENARLIDEIRQRQAELRVTFDNMGDGVVMFDEELRLAAWNRNFQEMLDLSDAVLAARPSYAEYLRILAERGEFGTDDIESELQRRLAETDQELRFERTRPDGRVVEVRRNAVPGGGFVLIYSDITERKEAEARLRGARHRRGGTARIAGGAGQSDPCRKDGLARAVDRRHRPRDQKPVEFRQQLCRTVGRVAG